jgi:X-Pro dipeptidyl-peptidase (S15 family)
LGLATAFVLSWSASASAAPLGLDSCATVEGVHRCDGLVKTWDGVPLDVTVVLPSAEASDLPLVTEIHGFGNSKYEYLDPASGAYTDNAYNWAKEGYAVLTYTARGLWGSCGTPEARLANAADCASGYIHLADSRYEARDAQHLIGLLVDEGVADPGRIGVTGDSYGGGQSFELAALRNRTMLPDGTLVPWTSPGGTPLEIAAAAPVIPWTSIIGAIAPNGRTRAYEVTPPGAQADPVGVFKLSVANAILAAAQNAIGPGQPTGEPFIPGRPMGYLSPVGTDPEADVTGWVARADAGEPYSDANAQEIVSQLERFHSPYGIDDSVPPPPLYVGAGFSDDLFPVDETLRFTNRMRAAHPQVPLSLYFGDYGHQRASNKPADRQLLVDDIHDWFDHYLKGAGAAPRTGVRATTQTCPRDEPSEGPFSAPTFARLARGEVRLSDSEARTFSQGGGDPSIAAAIDPAAGQGDGCVEVSSRDVPNTATYRLPAATGAGYTLLGAPEITAALEVTGAAPEDAQVDARLWDVAGDSQRLVARGTLRPSGGATDTWELHANGWRFAAGHVAKLELLGADPPYARPSNAAFTVEVSNLELRLPTREGAAPMGAAAPGTQVTNPPASKQQRHKKHKRKKKRRRKHRSSSR